MTAFRSVRTVTTVTSPAWLTRVGISTAISAAIASAGCASTAPSSSESEELFGRASQVEAPLLPSPSPDPTARGPYEVTSSEYRFPAEVNPNVLADRATEMWARVYRPTRLDGSPRPVLVFLHGNHGTCGRGTAPRRDDDLSYTTRGQCPRGYVVTPNHLGYGYLAETLSSHGFVVVSINANRGITGGDGVSGDGGLNLARGRLVLEHLRRLAEWNATPGATPQSLGVDLAGKLDLAHVGLFGHSRGGEGVRAAYNLYRDAGSPWPSRIRAKVGFDALFEVGPVDGQTGRVLDADGTAWAVLLPMCDGDVSDLQGVRPFDRMLARGDETRATPKATYAVWGANHNFFNTEWQESDAASCGNQTALFSPTATGSAAQRQVALASVVSFFRAHVGATSDARLASVFDAAYELPEAATSESPIERGFVPALASSQARPIDDFADSRRARPATGGLRVSYGGVPSHDGNAARAARLEWRRAGTDVTFDVPVAAGISAEGYGALDVRVSRQASTLNGASPTTFSVVLVARDGTSSRAVDAASYVSLVGPAKVGTRALPILQTARIPFEDFGPFDRKAVAAVRLVFDRTEAGALYVSRVGFSAGPAAGTGPVGFAAMGRRAPVHSSWPPPAYDDEAATEPVIAAGTHRIVALERLAATGDPSAVGPDADTVALTVESTVPFPVRDELLVARIGDAVVDVSRAGAHPGQRTFLVPGPVLRSAPDGSAVIVDLGRTTPRLRWNVGVLSKAALR